MLGTNLLFKRLLREPLGKRLKLGLKFLRSFLGSLAGGERQAFLRHVLELLAVKFRQGVDGVLVNSFYQVQNFEALLQETLDERRGGDLNGRLRKLYNMQN